MKKVVLIFIGLNIYAINIFTQVIFTPPTTISNNQETIKSIFSIDIDGDGDLDILASSSGDKKIAWYENLGGSGSFGSEQIISQTLGENETGVYSTDIDGDGDNDILVGNVWLKNLDGLGSFSNAVTLVPFFIYDITTIHAGDIDGDGDNDVVYGVLPGNFYWIENLDGLGSFGTEQNFYTLTQFSGTELSTRLVDIDGDGDLDIICTLGEEDQVAWFENTNGLGSFGPKQSIGGSITSPTKISFADLDGDGDMDVLANRFDKFVWYENINGLGTFSLEKVISLQQGYFNTSDITSDIDRDGDLDIIHIGIPNIVWFENLDGFGNFSTMIEIPNTPNTYSLCMLDIDTDGDFDLIRGVANDKLLWHERQYRDPICVVTLDEVSKKNKIIWEQSHGQGIESYNIYKEVSTNVYGLIGVVPDDSLSVFTDTLSNPSAHNDRYKISAIDSLGHETELGNYHKTINLGISQGVPSTTYVLNWDHYVDESGDYVPSKYYIFKGDSLSNMQLYDSLPASQTAYNDLNVTGIYAYQIGIKKDECIPNTSAKKEASDFYFSNYVANGVIGIKEIDSPKLIEHLYPNPNNGSFTITTKENHLNYSIYDAVGQLVKEGEITKPISKIDIKNIHLGLFFVHLISEKGVIQVEKIIIE